MIFCPNHQSTHNDKYQITYRSVFFTLFTIYNNKLPLNVLNPLLKSLLNFQQKNNKIMKKEQFSFQLIISFTFTKRMLVYRSLALLCMLLCVTAAPSSTSKDPRVFFHFTLFVHSAARFRRLLIMTFSFTLQTRTTPTF